MVSVLSLLLLAADAPAVAVVPFRELASISGTTAGSVGVGIAETLASDLRRLGGLTIIERRALDAVIAELDLGATKELDPASSAQVGRLLGARWLVLGALQVSAGTARLTARVVEVETGRVLSGAKVDGPANRLFALQDQLVREVLAALGIRAAKKEAPPPARADAPLVVARYGQARSLPAGSARLLALQKLVADAPSFRPAVLDLDAVRAGLSAVGEQQRVKDAAALSSLLETIERRGVDDASLSSVASVVSDLRARRWLYTWRALGWRLATDARPEASRAATVFGYLQAYNAAIALNDKEGVVAAGAALAARFPDDPSVRELEWGLRQHLDVVERRSKARDHVRELVAALPMNERSDPCREVSLWRAEELFSLCVDYCVALDRCARRETTDAQVRAQAIAEIPEVCAASGDWATRRRAIAWAWASGLGAVDPRRDDAGPAEAAAPEEVDAQRAEEQRAAALARAQIARREREAADALARAKALSDARAKIVAAGEDEPKECGAATPFAALRSFGNSAALSALDAHCLRFARWRRPDAAFRSHAAELFVQLKQVDEWLAEVASCSPASREQNSREICREAVEARAMIASIRQELSGVAEGKRAFPCTTPTLARAAKREWAGLTAKAQMPYLEGLAARTCDDEGVSVSKRREAAHALDLLLASAEQDAKDKHKAATEVLSRLRGR